jgi:hypothetical protein
MIFASRANESSLSHLTLSIRADDIRAATADDSAQATARQLLNSRARRFHPCPRHVQTAARVKGRRARGGFMRARFNFMPLASQLRESARRELRRAARIAEEEATKS